MDNELILRQFEEVEEKVERLIGVCKSYEATNSDLKNRVKELEEELQNKVAAENSFTEEKVLIRSRIDSLLTRLKNVSEA